MKTLSVQQQPNGFEVEVPSFAYWMKAGVAFTLGAGVVYLFTLLIWTNIIYYHPELLMWRALTR